MKTNTDYRQTYCNPLALPDYPRGSEVNGFSNCRELADPTVIWHNGKWILYATIGSVYESEDYINWKVCDKSRIPPLVAPTVVEYKSCFYLMGSESPLYKADSPYGPFAEMGMICDAKGQELYLRDPMLFADDDKRLYLYWGLGVDGIYGMELDEKHPCSGLSEPISLFRYEKDHIWERLGAWNQNKRLSFIEGAWMHKHKGSYYLIYAASGTCYSTYALGVYRSDSPLSGFVSQKNNPILLKRYGLVTGTGHGSIVKGPKNTLWAFYTIKLCYATKYERRIAMDAAGFDEEGSLFIGAASEVPQWAPGVCRSPETDNGAGLLPLTSEEQVKASSSAPGRDALYALDGSMLTWWQPEDSDEQGRITINIRSLSQVCAVRIIWRDVNLDYDRGVGPGAFQYLVEACEEEEEETWKVLLDCRNNREDYTVDYRTFAPSKARYIRLTITGAPAGIRPGVIDFTAFGICL